MKDVIIYLGIGCFIVNAWFWNKSPKMKEEYFNIKNYTDLVTLIMLYFTAMFLSITDYILLWETLLVALFLFILYIIALRKSIQHIILSKNKDKRTVPIIITMLLKLIIYFATINYCIYRLDNTAYNMLINLEWYRVAFEFLYYSFCKSIILGSEGIEPISIMAKLLSMLQIVVSYYLIGEGIIIIIDLKGKTDKHIAAK